MRFITPHPLNINSCTHSFLNELYFTYYSGGLTSRLEGSLTQTPYKYEINFISYFYFHLQVPILLLKEKLNFFQNKTFKKDKSMFDFSKNDVKTTIMFVIDFWKIITMCHFKGESLAIELEILWIKNKTLNSSKRFSISPRLLSEGWRKISSNLSGTYLKRKKNY